MTNPIPIPIRPWSRLAPLPSSQYEIAQPSLKPTNNSSHDNSKSATKSQPHVHNSMQSQELKLTTPMIFSPSKSMLHPQPVEEFTVQKPNSNVSLKKESGENQIQGIAQNAKKVATQENEKQGKGFHTSSNGIRVITIAGENRGAEMQITMSQKKSIHNKGERVYGNSNVQCVNNSMLFNTSLTHHDPGMHLVIPKKPIAKGFHLKK
ncbi:hypothetical protein Fmac_010688 [Flemingia macrophylla]|uniref:Uncharacterized protein n=1 Tax=Flemingia macrophylla TaxID=520843 RepID=A0ABD1ML16_9FABA